MTAIKLQIANLRKIKAISQKQLAEILGVSYQTISKWENNICMPDITILPLIAEYFEVSIDELLGLKPLHNLEYIPAYTDSKEYWNDKIEFLKRTRKAFINDDYIKHLVDNIWKIDKAIDIIDFGCGFGYLGKVLLPLLPKGSTYTGIDINEMLLKEAKRIFSKSEYQVEFINKNIYDFKPLKKYDMAICQAFLRHTNKPVEILGMMIDSVKAGGIITCIEVDREIEKDGLYIEGMDYEYVCSRNGIQKLWQKELELQGRDYAIGIRLPVIMSRLGLVNVDIRINDRVTYINPSQENYTERVEDFIVSNTISKNISDEEDEKTIERLMNHGIDKVEAEAYCKRDRQISKHIYENIDNLYIVQLRGLLIAYGIKPLA